LPVTRDDRVCEEINGPFVYELRGTRAIAKGWLALHESWTIVRFTEAGTAMFA
jgi:hypothetical protein